MPVLEEALPVAADCKGLPRPGVSIVIPCLNEAATIGPCVKRAAEAIEAMRARFGLDGEIIVADNGSTDGSQDIARRGGARVVTVARRGYGAALIAGMKAARGRYLVMGDADCSYDFMESVHMVETLIDGGDICMGSRFRGEIKPDAMPWKNKYIGNPVLSAILRLLFKTEISDAHCGLRALTRECFDELGLTSPGMEFASEMVLKASMTGRAIAEVPVTLWPDARGRKPHLRPWRDGWRHLRFMLMLSPYWLFLVPSAIMGLIGLALFVALLTQPEGSMLQVAGLSFGDHWMILAAGMMTIAHQLFLFGFAAAINGVKEGYRRASPRFIRLLYAARLEHMLLAGLTLIVIGVLIMGKVVYGWAGADFGALAARRDVVAGTTLVVLGVQNSFGGFLLSIVAGNRARLDELIEEIATKAETAPANSGSGEPERS